VGILVVIFIGLLLVGVFIFLILIMYTPYTLPQQEYNTKKQAQEVLDRKEQEEIRKWQESKLQKWQEEQQYNLPSSANVEKESKPTIITQQSLVSSLQSKQAALQQELIQLQAEEQQALKTLEELRIKEELSKLSKEQLLEQAYLRETKGIELNSLSQEELTALMKVLTKLRGSK
jgi:hypothetical protein